MSDSSDIDFSDDDAIFEQRKQELIAEAKKDHDLQFADPAFRAQFDPSSPTYHGGADKRIVKVSQEQTNVLPAELQKYYGKATMSIEDMPDVNDDVFREDPAKYGPVYVILAKFREDSLELKKLISRLQTLLHEYLRLIEADITGAQLTNAITYLDMGTSTVSRVVKEFGPVVAKFKAFDKTTLSENGITQNLYDFDGNSHIREINNILNELEKFKGLDKIDKLAKEQDLYYSMKRITSQMTIKQQEVLAQMKIVKKFMSEKQQKM
jgi:hypothetical protein